jgi:hypothetical protein
VDAALMHIERLAYGDRERVESAWLWSVVFVRSRQTAVTGVARPPPGAYDMDAATMHLEQHERGNHVV